MKNALDWYTRVVGCLPKSQLLQWVSKEPAKHGLFRRRTRNEHPTSLIALVENLETLQSGRSRFSAPGNDRCNLIQNFCGSKRCKYRFHTLLPKFLIVVPLFRARMHFCLSLSISPHLFYLFVPSDPAVPLCIRYFLIMTPENEKNMATIFPVITTKATILLNIQKLTFMIARNKKHE